MNSELIDVITFSMTKTILKTKRLTLEKIEIQHLENLYLLLSNPKVQQYFPKTLTKSETLEFYDTIQKRYHRDGYCYWAVIRNTDYQYLGICGLIRQMINEKSETEVGYRFLDTFWKKGYATEAAKGCISYAREMLALNSVISLIKPINIPSVRVAEKNGFKKEGSVMFQGELHGLYRLIY